jgi:hypothetical protein
VHVAEFWRYPVKSLAVSGSTAWRCGPTGSSGSGWSRCTARAGAWPPRGSARVCSGIGAPRAMTTYESDTRAQDLDVLRRTARAFGGTMALDCAVVAGGPVRVGDPVTLLWKGRGRGSLASARPERRLPPPSPPLLGE